MRIERFGRCNCGRVVVSARGEPVRVGVCHCLNCRRQSGSPFLAYAVWPLAAVTVEGETITWQGPLIVRHFCPVCGSMVWDSDSASDEIEIPLGLFDDAPTDLRPDHECWTVRREKWLKPIDGARQYLRDRTSGDRAG
ncbi:MAG: hypothetical protein BGP06_13405 [Rhizobiales bacterium 65-9]|nr:GFA family protein [Hyphomicrobiales bacterium]OJY36924.1 MAG: hypothetical protein BGP06_13405 [Rhizobiales bacterium 65-9]